MRKALYELKQAPRAWYSKIDHYFRNNGFTRSENKPTLYFIREGNGNFLLICLYVDDMIFMGSSESLVANFKSSIMKTFEMTDLGLLRYFLGLKVKQALDGIFVCQKKYFVDLLKRLNMSDFEIAVTPMNANENLQREDGTKAANAKLFRSLVGGLYYLTNFFFLKLIF